MSNVILSRSLRNGFSKKSSEVLKLNLTNALEESLKVKLSNIAILIQFTSYTIDKICFTHVAEKLYPNIKTCLADESWLTVRKQPSGFSLNIPRRLTK